AWLGRALARLGAGVGWAGPPPAPPARAATVGGLLLAGIVTGLFYFSAVIDPLLTRPAEAPIPPSLAESFARSWAERGTKLSWVGQALALGFLPPLICLAPLGFV